MATIRRVDRQGRIALPSKWRLRSLKGSEEVVIIENDDILEIRPRRSVDLTKYFDSFTVDVDPKSFLDYKELKKSLLKGDNTKKQRHQRSDNDDE